MAYNDLAGFRLSYRLVDTVSHALSFNVIQDIKGRNFPQILTVDRQRSLYRDAVYGVADDRDSLVFQFRADTIYELINDHRDADSVYAAIKSASTSKSYIYRNQHVITLDYLPDSSIRDVMHLIQTKSELVGEFKIIDIAKDRFISSAIITCSADTTCDVKHFRLTLPNDEHPADQNFGNLQASPYGLESFVSANETSQKSYFYCFDTLRNVATMYAAPTKARDIVTYQSGISLIDFDSDSCLIGTFDREDLSFSGRSYPFKLFRILATHDGYWGLSAVWSTRRTKSTSP